MSIANPGPNYGGRQPTNSQYIKQFFTSDTSRQADWVFTKKSGITAITPINKNFPVLIENDLYVTGHIYNTSDKNCKEQIEPLTLSKIFDLEPVKYNFKTDFKKQTHYGFIAQDVEKVYPELVNNNNLGLKTVDYIEMIPLLLLKMKDMQKEIDELRKQVGIVRSFYES